MFFVTGGTSFHIGSPRTDWQARTVASDDFSGETWIEVGGITGLGRISGEWTGPDYTTPDCGAPDEALMPTFIKAVRPTPTMQIIAGVIGDDPGQLAMLAAEASVAAYGFRITLPDGAERRFVAFIIGADHIFDEANAVLCWGFTLRLQSNVARA